MRLPARILGLSSRPHQHTWCGPYSSTRQQSGQHSSRRQRQELQGQPQHLPPPPPLLLLVVEEGARQGQCCRALA